MLTTSISHWTIDSTAGCFETSLITPPSPPPTIRTYSLLIIKSRGQMFLFKKGTVIFFQTIHFSPHIFWGSHLITGSVKFVDIYLGKGNSDWEGVYIVTYVEQGNFMQRGLKKPCHLSGGEGWTFLNNPIKPSKLMWTF